MQCQVIISTLSRSESSVPMRLLSRYILEKTEVIFKLCSALVKIAAATKDSRWRSDAFYGAPVMGHASDGCLHMLAKRLCWKKNSMVHSIRMMTIYVRSIMIPAGGLIGGVKCLLSIFLHIYDSFPD